MDRKLPPLCLKCFRKRGGDSKKKEFFLKSSQGKNLLFLTLETNSLL